MIRVERSLTTIPAALADSGSLAAGERLQAQAFYDALLKARAAAAAAAAPPPPAKKAPATKSGKKGAKKKAQPQTSTKKTKKTQRKEKTTFSFEAYSDDSVKRALNSLFGGKCAYCESRYAQTQPMDVEHFRPKARVDGAADHPGYHWLASEWKNLLPSCIDCNRKRTHELRQPGGTRTTVDANAASDTSTSAAKSKGKGAGKNKAEDKSSGTHELVLGKGDRFPLADGTPRARAKGEEITEHPLLLHPCEDTPEKFLHFTDDGVVMPAEKLTAREHERAKVSILIYGLNRSELVQSRLEVLRLLQARFHCIRTLARVLDSRKLNPALKDIIEDLMTHEIAGLNRFIDRASPYSLMCLQVINRFKEVSSQ